MWSSITVASLWAAVTQYATISAVQVAVIAAVGYGLFRKFTRFGARKLR